MAIQSTKSFSISVSKIFSKIIIPIIVLGNINPVLAASKSPTAKLLKQKFNSDKILIADFRNREQRIQEREQRQAEYRRRAEQGRRERQARQEESRRQAAERQREIQAQQEAEQRYFNSLSPEEQQALIQKQRERQQQQAEAAASMFLLFMGAGGDGGSSSSEDDCKHHMMRTSTGACVPNPTFR